MPKSRNRRDPIGSRTPTTSTTQQRQAKAAERVPGIYLRAERVQKAELFSPLPAEPRFLLIAQLQCEGKTDAELLQLQGSMRWFLDTRKILFEVSLQETVRQVLSAYIDTWLERGSILFDSGGRIRWLMEVQQHISEGGAR